MSEVGRAQDQGRAHRRRAAPSQASVSLLKEYREAMRRDLRECLRVLEPVVGDQLGLDGKPYKVAMPIAERMRIWDLAIKLGRELGSEVDPPAPPAPRSVGGAPRVRARDL